MERHDIYHVAEWGSSWIKTSKTALCHSVCWSLEESRESLEPWGRVEVTKMYRNGDITSRKMFK